MATKATGLKLISGYSIPSEDSHPFTHSNFVTFYWVPFSYLIHFHFTSPISASGHVLWPDDYLTVLISTSTHLVRNIIPAYSTQSNWMLFLSSPFARITTSRVISAYSVPFLLKCSLPLYTEESLSICFPLSTVFKSWSMIRTCVYDFCESCMPLFLNYFWHLECYISVCTIYAASLRSPPGTRFMAKRPRGFPCTPLCWLVLIHCSESLIYFLFIHRANKAPLRIKSGFAYNAKNLKSTAWKNSLLEVVAIL